jgi:hypothetical protein
VAPDYTKAGRHHHLGFDEPEVRDELTGRVYERGSGALPYPEQARLFAIEAAILADLPKPDEVCPITGKPYQSVNETTAIGIKANLTRNAQTRAFLLGE